MPLILSSTNRSALYYAVEASAGEVPSPLNVNTLNITTNDLNIAQTNVQSETLRSDRQRGELVLTQFNAEGSFTTELRYGEMEPFMESIFFNTINASNSVTGTDIAAAVSGSEYKFTSTTTDFTTLNLKAGQYIKVTGFGNTNNNGIFKVSETVAVTATELKLDASTPVITEAAGNNVTIKSSRLLENGVTPKTFTFVRAFEDVGEYFLFRGMIGNTLALNFAQGQIPTAQYNFVGLEGIYYSADPTNTKAPAATTPVMNPTTNFNKLKLGGISVGLVRSLTLNMNNNVNPAYALGTTRAVDLVDGSVDITGSFELFFQDGSEFSKFANSQATSLELVFTDNAGNSVVLYVPELKYAAFPINVPGRDEVVIVNADFTAYVDPNIGKSIRIEFFDA